MPYILYKSNGQKLATIADGSIDTTSASLTFVGKNYAGYGEILNQNIVKLLENFANTSQPALPLIGQVWYDTGSKNLKVYNGSKFKAVQTFDTGTTQPVSPNKGDLWFNESDQKLYLFNGTRYSIIGPQDSQFSGVQLVASEARDNTSLEGSPKYVMKFNINDSIPAVVSDTSFTPNVSDNLISENYAGVATGITLPGAGPLAPSGNGISYPTSILWGTAATALGLYDKDSDVFHSASSYLLTSQYTSDLASGLNITNDSGILVGNIGVFRFHSDSGNSEGKITAVRGNKITFSVVRADTATTSTVVQFNQNNIIPNSSWGINLGTSAYKFDRGYINTITSTAITATSVVATTVTSGLFVGPVVGNLTGNVTGNLTGAIITATNYFSGTLLGPISGNVTTAYIQAVGGAESSTGQIKGRWTLVGASTLAASYSDLAERYAADAVYEVGTVLVVGGDAEVTTTIRRADVRVAGIVSDKPAYMMNADAGTDETHPYLALKGRVPCKVVGPIKKGDLLVTSSFPGVACAGERDDNANAVIGKALEDHSEGFGVIEVKV